MTGARSSRPDLDAYRGKRDFRETPEPAGKAETVATGNRFVVQKHAASHLHYDLRLQLHGTLKSWALPKGPSLDPTQRRLAQHVEDHPLEYAEFEGIIPPGEYGAGTVLIWDAGEWEPLDEGKQGYYRGRLRFILHGQRLRGRWSLTRENKESHGWNLLKEDDEFASAASIENWDTSVASGRTMNEIASDRTALWTRDQGFVPSDPLMTFGHRPGGSLPDFIAPQLATLVDDVPYGEEWLHEIKYDGYRIVCRIHKQHGDSGGIRFLTRKGIDFTDRLRTLAEAVAALPVSRAWLDGEIAVLTPEGRSDFNALQNSFNSRTDREITYLVFDLMNYEGYDIRGAPLSERKDLLQQLIPSDGRIRYVAHIAGQGREFYRAACAQKLEGVVSKRADSDYVSERSRRWLKVTCAHRQEFVLGGYTESGAGRIFGSLLAGYFDEGGRLVFAGKIKTGYSAALSKKLMAVMQRYEQPTPPFVNPPSGVEYRNPHWLSPELVAEVQYTEITAATRLLRHASFKGLREDKDAREVTLQSPAKVTEVRDDAPKQQPVFPRERIMREAIRDYYSSVADRMLLYTRDRPLTLIVCPTNIYACKFTKHATHLAPSVKGIDVAGHEERYIAVDSAEGLLALVDAGTVEFHGWQSRYSRLEFPDRLVFDLDPPGTEQFDPERLVDAALFLRLHLEGYGLRSFIQTTGGKGYYIVVPLIPEKTWPAVTGFARAVAEDMARQHPKRVTADLAKNDRGDRIYIDWMRNGRGSNSAEPYSLRARPGAPIATPIEWEELVSGIGPDAFTLHNISRRFQTGSTDPWENYAEIRQSLRG